MGKETSFLYLNEEDMIKAGAAVTGNMNWTVNGSKSEGKKMVKDMQKLLLRAFNSECDEVQIDFTGPLSPIRIKPLGDESYIGIVLPVRNK